MILGLIPTAALLIAAHGVFAGDTDPFPQWSALSSDRLDELRGGFVTDSGITITLGIERLFFVNDQLISKIVLHVPQLGAALAMLQPAPDGQPPAAPGTGSASAPPSPVGGQPAPASTVPSSAASSAGMAPLAQLTGAPVNSPTAASRSGSALTTASNPVSGVSVTSPTPSVTLIQSGVKNFVDDKIAQSIGPGLATVIQNNVDKQILSAMTVVNMRISGVGSLGIANTLSSLNLQLRLSGR
jgi:hypothetical protein